MSSVWRVPESRGRRSLFEATGACECWVDSGASPAGERLAVHCWCMASMDS